MRKAELLNSSKILASKEIVDLALSQKLITKTDYGTKITSYEYYWFYRAKVIDIKNIKILKVALFRRKELIRGLKTPAYEIFISKDENRYMTYDYENQKWKTAKIDYLDCGESYYYYLTPARYYGRDAEKIIVDYIDNGKMVPYDAIYQFQTSIKEENLRRQHRKITDRIDAVMELVPALPKDLDDWIYNVAMVKSRYIYYTYKKGVNEGYCTHCKKTVPISKPKHNTTGVCKCCHSEITFKAIKKAAVVKDKGYASIFQRTKEGFILRYFEIYREYDDIYNPVQKTTEAIRVIYDERLNCGPTYDYTEFKNTGIIRWCYYDDQGWNNRRYIYPSALYDKNLKKVFEGTEYQYSAIDQFTKGLKGEYFYPGEYLKEYGYHKFIEYLVKLKLYRITKGYINSSCGHNEIFENGKRIHDVLKISKEQVKMICEMNASLTELRVLQKANKAKVKITKEQIRWIAENLGRNELINYMKYSTAHKMVRYLKEQSIQKKIGPIASDYYDYLETCEKLGYNLKNTFILFPKRLDEAHDLVISEWKQKKEQIDKMQDDERNKEMELIAEELVKKYAMKDKQFSIRIPWTCDEIKKEGQELHHCVGTYVDRVLRKETTILFIRKIDDINTSFYTMEVRGTEIIQVRGKNNCSTTPEVQAFVEKFKTKKLESLLERMAG
jgi:hypothetical protein